MPTAVGPTTATIGAAWLLADQSGTAPLSRPPATASPLRCPGESLPGGPGGVPAPPARRRRQDRGAAAAARTGGALHERPLGLRRGRAHRVRRVGRRRAAGRPRRSWASTSSPPTSSRCARCNAPGRASPIPSSSGSTSSSRRVLERRSRDPGARQVPGAPLVPPRRAAGPRGAPRATRADSAGGRAGAPGHEPRLLKPGAPFPARPVGHHGRRERRPEEREVRPQRPGQQAAVDRRPEALPQPRPRRASGRRGPHAGVGPGRRGRRRQRVRRGPGRRGGPRSPTSRSRPSRARRTCPTRSSSPRSSTRTGTSARLQLGPQDDKSD